MYVLNEQLTWGGGRGQGGGAGIEEEGRDRGGGAERWGMIYMREIGKGKTPRSTALFLFLLMYINIYVFKAQAL